MLTSTKILLEKAQAGGYAIGAFNVYNLEGVRAVTDAAEQGNSPVILQLHPQALTYGGTPLVALCLEAAKKASVPVSVHLDHSNSKHDIQTALNAGVMSIMADGSHLPYSENVSYTKEITELVHSLGGFVEAELGRLSGTEDGLTVEDREAKLTDPDKARSFVEATKLDALAVCIGNVHGKYSGEPNLDFDRLGRIRDKVNVPLVLHGASGLSVEMLRQSIELGVYKFNVNTEVRDAYMRSLKTTLVGLEEVELLDLMNSAIEAMKEIVFEKLSIFSSIKNTR